MSATENLRILWIVQGVQAEADGGFSSRLASNRYRAILPAGALEAAGHSVRFVEASQCQWPPAEAADVVIVGKLLPGARAEDFAPLSGRVLDAVRAATSAGVPVVADFNDDHFGHPLMGGHWRALAQAATLCVVGSEAMADTVARHTRQPTAIVGDPLGSPASEPKVFRKAGGMSRLLGNLTGGGKGADRLKMAWYGSPTNWPAMQAWAERLAPLAAQQRFIVWAVTQPSPGIESFVAQFNAKHGPDAAMELVPWDEDTQWSVVRDADLVLLPSDPSDPKKAVKTSNRLTDALHAGRYVIASPVPSYLPFAPFTSLTDDPLAAVQAFLADPDAHLAKIGQGRTAALMAASTAVIGQRWLDAIARARSLPAPAADAPPVAHAPSPATSAPQADPIRLNLGCGDKVLPGFVNVDVVASRRGRAPDVLCDLHDLSAVFADNHADEVMAIHVVEHFWRWEVEDILREWIRVLKPGGRMVLECPNLRSACEAFLRDPERGSESDQRGQQTMWVFYGDPAWKDPYMIHRWGYTPESLARLMQGVGLVNVRQEPAQYKLREPRDMRLVGEKPAA